MKLNLHLLFVVVATALPQQPSTTPGCWKDLAPIAGGARQEHSVVSISPNIYIIGGLQSGRVSGSVEVYNTESNKWSSIPRMTIGLHHTNAASVDGKLYVLGGIPKLNDWHGSPKAYVYDPATITWSKLPDQPSPRGSAVVSVRGKTIYLAGGLEVLGTASPIVTSFDTKTKKWSTLPDLPGPRDHGGGAIIGDTFYFFGGRTGMAVRRQGETWALNLTDPSSKWVQKTSMPTPRGGMAVAAIGSKIYAFGGEGNPDTQSGVFDQTDIYDAKTDTWSRGPSMQHPRHGMGAAAIVDKIYLPGGGEKLSQNQTVAITDAFEAQSC